MTERERTERKKKGQKEGKKKELRDGPGAKNSWRGLKFEFRHLHVEADNYFYPQLPGIWHLLVSEGIALIYIPNAHIYINANKNKI